MARAGAYPSAAVGRADVYGVAFTVAFFLAAVALACMPLGQTTDTLHWSCPGLSTSAILWVCTSPAWLCRPCRGEAKRLVVGASVSFAFIGAAVFIGTAVDTLLTR